MVSAIPRLQAEEQLRAIEVGQLSSGLLEKKASDQMFDRIMTEAKIGRAERRPRKAGALPPRMFAGLNVINEQAPAPAAAE